VKRKTVVPDFAMGMVGAGMMMVSRLTKEKTLIYCWPTTMMRHYDGIEKERTEYEREFETQGR